MPLVHPFTAMVGLACLSIAAGYGILNLIAILAWQLRKAPPKNPSQLPPVTLLKPLCGAEPGLYEQLRSFCRQEYPEFQIVFGMRDPSDPARSVVDRLVREFPAIPIDVVVNPQQHGSSCKISNLINMLARARHDVLALADSDVCVGPDYLATVTAPLLDRNAGLVTCICRGVPTGRIWSRLGAMYINEWYIPSVLLAWLFGHQGYVSGQSLCLRRETLAAIGGLQAVANQLADDYQLGELVRGLGLRIVLSPYVIRVEHHEPDLASLIRHELRWMRTIRMLRPRSFRLMFLSFILPLAIVGIALASAGSAFSIAAWTLFAATVIARLGLHLAHRLRGDRSAFSDVWLLPVRDLLLCWVWCRSFLGSRVTWRGNEFDVDSAGVMRKLS